ncbi:MAG TPA: YeiH family protein [Gemmatimonadaceae bacterium]|nr:YeiH family protein [Gemmatimonadaceae bacterium]
MKREPMIPARPGNVMLASSMAPSFRRDDDAPKDTSHHDRRLTSLVPGILLATVVSLVSLGIANVEERLFGHAIIEGLVVAILVGMLVRTLWTPPAAMNSGVSFTAKQVLEVAIFLLGASVDLPLLLRAGPSLAIGIVLLVILGICGSYSIGRMMGLPHKLAVLVACGNSICGNSAIAAIAPVIGAKKEHVVSSIAFTAILGVVVVLGLPLLIHPLGLNNYQYGVLAGLSVYAVPQVLAAAFPVSILSGQVGTLVKLVRVLMLGPVVIFFALTHPNETHGNGANSPRFQLTRFVPWFIIGFLLLAILRSTNAIPATWVAPTRSVSTWFTVAAMAALGLGVDLKAISKVGPRVITTVTGSLCLLIVLSLTLIHFLHIS